MVRYQSARTQSPLVTAARESTEGSDGGIHADGTDAWFAPAPSVLSALAIAANPSFTIPTTVASPRHALARAIARARGVPERAIVIGAEWLALADAGCARLMAAGSRVLVVDPLDQTYLAILEARPGVRVKHLAPAPLAGFRVDLDHLAAAAGDCDWVVLINPNNPTGRRIDRSDLQTLFAESSHRTKWWVDETYVDFAGPAESLEAYAAQSPNVVVCKSMSPAYALSGAAVAYLCGPPALIALVDQVSSSPTFPGELVASHALQSIDYYRARWTETVRLRCELADGLRGLGLTVVPTSTNFLLCRLSQAQPDAAAMSGQLRQRGMLIAVANRLAACAESRAIRIAVMDRDTNLAMLEILRDVLASRLPSNFSLSSALAHDL